ncbi:ABC transporter substrate-binding protein [Paenibacillus daejeonensis]|uniref:ABC transporter substrate-binding protein n=1 Tax=Paenibacillus daejeonensis TaxID=135193 RepID=UPI000381CDEB|nr:ABC transporter substrate-binding protein [Paenibacillus daejeonensis]
MRTTYGYWLSAACLALLLLLSACGSTNQTEQGTNLSSDTEQETDAPDTEDVSQEGATRTYTHVSGESKIPVKPQRVVSDWYYGELVALGVRPIGLTSYVLTHHPFIEPEGTEDIGSTPNLEKVLELQPDLILLYGNNENYEQFSKIAPTVGLELYPDPINTMQVFGDLLGREQEANDWIANFEAKTAAAKAKLAEHIGKDETFTIFTVWRKELRVYGDINMGGYILYNALGLSPQERVLSDIIQGESINAGHAISMEELSSFAGDHIILTTFDADELTAELKESGIWQGLEAVQNGQVYEIDFDLIYNEDPVAMEHQLDLLTDLLTQDKAAVTP